MGVRESLQRLIERKQGEVRELEMKVREANAYLQALQDSLRLIPKEADAPVSGEFSLRPGSTLAKVRAVIQANGAPMHINEILKSLNKPVDLATRTSLVGTLGSYSRKNRIFSRPAPNTFGLLEADQNRTTTDDDIPSSFGKMDDAIPEMTDDDIPF
jgi:hypothetical protein